MAAPAHQPAASPPRWFPWLAILVVLGVAATIVVTGAVLLQSYLITTGGGAPIATSNITFDDLGDAHPLPAGWQFAGFSPDVGIPVTPTAPRADLAVAYLVTALPAALLNVVAFVMLMRVIMIPGITTDRVLFSGATVDRLRRIGRFVLIAAVVVILYSIVTWNALRVSLLPAGIYPELPSVMGAPLTGPAVTLGIVIFGVAGIIQRGRLMREDLEGLV